MSKIADCPTERATYFFGASLMPILKSLSNWNEKNLKSIILNLSKNFDENRL